MVTSHSEASEKLDEPRLPLGFENLRQILVPLSISDKSLSRNVPVQLVERRADSHLEMVIAVLNAMSDLKAI